MSAVTGEIAYAGNPLDRANLRRRDHRWVEERERAPESRFLPIWQLMPLLKLGDPRELAWAKREFFEDLEPRPEPVLLGIRDEVAHFAVDVSAAPKREASFGVADVASFEDLRAAVAELPAQDAAIAAQARTLVDWHCRHRSCSACGGHTRSVQGGANRVCFDCQAEHFPRTDPVAIMLVLDGERALLGRQKIFAPLSYSALAGFMEPGETIEDCARREVFEEAGIRVGKVDYRASQPWPFPANLMIGLIGEALSRDVVVDRVELEDARWFDPDEARAMLADTHPDGLKVPTPMAIAHHLVRAALGID